MKNICSFLSKSKKGFSGITHCLIALVIFELIWLIPIFNFMTDSVKSQSFIYKAIFWLVICGAALLPDLDTNTSSAGYALGFVGKLLHTFMVATASLMYSIFKTKKDETLTQHRMFWHTPISCLLLYGYGFMCYKAIEDFGTILDCFKSEGISIILISYIFIEILVISSFYLALTKVFYNIGRICLKKMMRPLQFITITAFTVFIVLKGTPKYLFQLYGAVCLGALLHIIGDLFSKGSVPLFFPIPVKGKAFWKSWFPFQIETNGTMNRILDIVLFIISVVLMIVIVKGKDILLRFLG